MSLRSQNSKYWCFTINNPTVQDELDVQRLRELSTYIVYQLESGTDGTKHYQGYVEFANRKKGTTVKNIAPRAHLQSRRGTAKQASDYCKKEESRVDGPWEHGEIYQPKQGNRMDLQRVKEAIDEGKSITHISNEHFGAFVRYRKGFEAYMALNDTKRNFKTQVVILVGDAGTGKSTLAGQFPTPYFVLDPTSTQFFDGYDPREHDTVVFDDFNGGVKFHTMLKLMDEHPMIVNTKGGVINWKPKWLIITSNKQPDEWYMRKSLDPRLWAAFVRRINYKIDFKYPHLFHTDSLIGQLPVCIRQSLLQNFDMDNTINKENYELFR